MTSQALRSAVAEIIDDHTIDFQGVPHGEHTSAEWIALAVLRAVVETLGVTREVIDDVDRAIVAFNLDRLNHNPHQRWGIEVASVALSALLDSVEPATDG